MEVNIHTQGVCLLACARKTKEESVSINALAIFISLFNFSDISVALG